MTAILDRHTAVTAAHSRAVQSRTYSRAEIIALIKRDGQCGWARARLTLFFAEDRTKRRCHGRMTIPQMLLIHPVLTRIMPDGAVAKPATAHAALNQLAPADRPFVHSKNLVMGKWFCHWSLGVMFEPR